jgi:hypothetical protein
LQPETIESLKAAQKAVEEGGFLPRYSLQPEQTLLSSEDSMEICANEREKSQYPQHQKLFTSACSHPTTRDIHSNFQVSSSAFHINQSFMMMPPKENLVSFLTKTQDVPSSMSRNRTSDTEEKSLKSSSSMESFKSAISLQEADLDLARQVKAIQTVLHAFRTALQILQNLIEKRIPDRDGEVYFAAKDLEGSLQEGSKAIHDKHIGKFKEHGQSYLESFTPFRKLLFPGDKLAKYLHL